MVNSVHKVLFQLFPDCLLPLTARGHLINILSSDYVPFSLLLGAVILGLRNGNIARGLATVTQAPAAVAGLDDRGIFEAGRRADIVRFKVAADEPILGSVWCNGTQVA